MKIHALALLLGLSGLVMAASLQYVMHSVVKPPNKPSSQARSWCDAPKAVIALTHLPAPGSTAQTSNRELLYVWPKTRRGLGQLATAQVEVAAPDPGAGQVVTPLKFLSGSRRAQSGVLHTSNVENVNDPAYRMTHVNEFRLGNTTYRCRYVPQAAFLGVTGKRTVILWESRGRATYATRNFDNTPGMYLTGGTPPDAVRKTSPMGFAGVYTWTAPGGTEYRLNLPRNELVVWRKDRVIGREQFLAYSISHPAPWRVAPTN